MSKYVVVASTCDNHRLMGNADVPAHAEHIIGLDKEAASVDLCEECEGDGSVISVLKALMAMGVPAGKNPLKPRVRKGGLDASLMPTLCPQCGRTFKNRGSLSSHMRQYHDKKKFSDYPNGLRSTADYAGLPYHF